ncbi:hypothetical protein P280DRAFT_523504 [Massarina eburnea CBS 473.64]|uniref:RING-type domain-containing protein n=1 Tax=Massarina eburnea CBS 473.64 TaxID=1395130 RepID=A0A6A6RJ09_9PLEO|nr:hypothetical protein P280DRAFT_523504 [Massarina eburnea CBS 473.64]
MADSDFSNTFRGSYPLAPSPPSLQAQDPDPLPPAHPGYNWSSAYDPPSYPSYMGQYGLHSPDPNELASYYSNPYAHHMHSGPRAPVFHGPPVGMSQQQRLPPMSALLPQYFSHMRDNLNPDFVDLRAMSRPFPANTMQNPMPNLNSPQAPQWHSPSHDFQHLLDLSIPPAAPQAPSQASDDAMSPMITDGGSSTRGASGQLTSPSRGNSYQRPHNMGIPERRTSNMLVPPARRPERSISPRTSHRRSFDRYSTDLSQSDSTPESDNPAHTPTHRSRRPRTMVPNRVGTSGFHARMMDHYDPNIPSSSQMQRLKDTLKKHVRNELAEDATCEICQKDYSETLVEPSDTEEVAVQLPCKHIFGEHCIHTWFETCKTQKNKVTCPMCRTLLIEPPTGRREEMLEMMVAARARGQYNLESFVQGERRRLMADLVRHPDLEGDFAHA